MTYTAGELAKKLGVSARTVRFYDEKNLLPPRGYSEAGYRLYDDESAERLQKILMLRFMDFSIEQIAEIMKKEHFDVRESLLEQERLLTEKKEHIERILAAVRKTRGILETGQNAGETPTSPTSAAPTVSAGMQTAAATTVSPSTQTAAASGTQDFWESMRRIIEITREREYIIAQYDTDSNLNSRISMHDYSTASIGFYPWMLDKIALAPNMKVLDIGCGNAAFWRGVAAKLPENLELHLVDYSSGMLSSAEKNMQEIQAQFPEKHLKYILDKRDATDFSYPVSGFDRIMANHLLFHLNREARFDLYKKINALLKEDGRFSCSLVGYSSMILSGNITRKLQFQAIPSIFFWRLLHRNFAMILRF